ncbi:MAG TPA: hypothetical protein VF017_05885 [Thermoanaerobaculia bacterium]|nr:hypothetical protein [Thermoanaerobaculia bacterium]
MAERHPDTEQWSRLIAGEVQSREATRLAWHLRHCEACQQGVAALADGERLLSSLLGSEPAPEVPAAAEAPEYDDIITRTYDALLRREADLERDRSLAPLLFEDLMRHPLGRQKVLVLNTTRYRSWGLIEMLLARTASAWFEAPVEALEHAEVALLLAESLDSLDYGEGLLNDLMARCWVYLGNSRRIASDFRGAEEAFAKADALLAIGTDDPLERGNFLRIHASLLRDQRRWAECRATLEKAVAIYQKVGDPHLAGKTLLSFAALQVEEGEADELVATLREAQSLIEPGREPHLEFGIQYNLITALVNAERFIEARTVLAKSRDLLTRQATDSDRRRLLWLQGVVARGLGQLESAEAYLLRAREQYAGLGLSADAALVSLDLAMVFLQQGKSAEVRRIAQEVLPIFQTLEIEREALAAVLIFREAADAERLTLGILREVSRRLAGAREQGISEERRESLGSQ